MRSSNRLRAVASGLLLILSTPPLPVYALAWMGLVPLFRAIEQSRDRRDAFQLGFLFGVVWHAGTAYWIAWNSGTPPVVSVLSAIALVGLLSFFHGLIGMLHRLLLKGFGRAGHLLVPLLWMNNDVIWQNGDWSFPWITLALTQIQQLAIVQVTALVGSVGLTGLIALLNGILAHQGRRWTGIAMVIVLMTGVWAWGTVREQAQHQQIANRPIATAAIVQGNVDPDVKWELGPWHSLTIYESLAESQVPRDVDLMVWPENAAPVYLRQDYRFRNHMQEFVDRMDVPLVTGGRYADFLEEGRIPYNAAFYIEPGMGGRFSLYKKVYLVPFGERIPFQWLFPKLRELDFGQAEFAPGNDIITWPIQGRGRNPVDIAPLICYEANFPQAGKRAVELGADFMVNMTNDGWFTGTGQQPQHLLLSRVRSVETGRSLVRATNTGISAFITPTGRMTEMLPADVRGVIYDEVLPPIDTPYQAFGWRIRWGVMIVMAVVVLLAAVLGADGWVRPRRQA